MGIRKHNDMKEHNISRIHSIRHPSPANTHQSLCAHNLITKHITAAKQPRCSDALLLMQAKIPQLFLLLKTCQLEDCGGVRRVEGIFIIITIIVSWQDFCIPTAICFSRPLLFLFFCPSMSCAALHKDHRGESSGESRANWPSTQCELWVWSGQFPTETYVSTSKEWLYAAWILPACWGAIQTLCNKNPDTNGTGMAPTLSSGSVHSNNLASANPTCGEITAGRTGWVLLVVCEGLLLICISSLSECFWILGLNTLRCVKTSLL